MHVAKARSIDYEIDQVFEISYSEQENYKRHIFYGTKKYVKWSCLM